MNTLLITSSGPGHQNVEEVFLGEAVDCLPLGSVHWVGLVATTNKEPPHNTKLSGFDQYLAPAEHYPYDPRVRTRVAVALNYLTSFRRDVHTLSRRLSQFIDAQKPRHLWVVCSSLSVIEAAWRLTQDLQIPLLLQIWDDPMHLLQERRSDRLTKRRIMRHFEDLLRRAHKVAVIGESMQASYSRHTREIPIIIRHGLADIVHPSTDVSQSSEFRIGFCGGMYAASAWNSLERALESLNWKLAGRNVVLEVASPKIQLTAQRAAMIRYHGWETYGSSPKDCISRTSKVMSDCDLLYLPQAFESSSRPITELSFPTKLSTYVSTGRPILVHTPNYGSLNQFCRAHAFGAVCNDLDSTTLASKLRSITETPESMKQLSRDTARIGSTVLSRATFRDSLFRFLGSESLEPDLETSKSVRRSLAETPQS